MAWLWVCLLIVIPLLIIFSLMEYIFNEQSHTHKHKSHQNSCTMPEILDNPPSHCGIYINDLTKEPREKPGNYSRWGR